jgi:erythromycin esterase-like protein
VRGTGSDEDADSALAGFERFPTWMWRNTVVLEFVEWLQAFNAKRPRYLDKVGFYGVDLYSLHSSVQAVLAYLDKIDPEAAKRARYRYACFDHTSDDPQAYGYAANFGLAQSCEEEVIQQLRDLQQRAIDYMNRDGYMAEDEYFFTEQNARLVKNAEEYYRTMFRGHISSWNLRDSHMADTIEALCAHLRRQTGDAKIVVWEHNSHLGDARATDASTQGEWNVGQLIRQKHANDAFLVGFSTHTGTVTASSDWGGRPERKQVRPSIKGSHENVLHQAGYPAFYLTFRSEDAASRLMQEERLERAIGVIYRPETERVSHYFYARMSRQFDAIIHLDVTRAVTPLEREQLWEKGELPETFPEGV